MNLKEYFERRYLDSLNDYLSRPRFLWKEASHLWIMIPENVREILELAV